MQLLCHCNCSYMKKYAIILFALHALAGRSQTIQDTSTTEAPSLPEVQIRVFDHARKLKDIPAAVAYVGKSALDRFSPSSIVPAVNTLPGVRMEERSPGSYRFNIRGSSLRSPFGVRNVKVYYNDLPVTDPGGQTFLNQFGYYSFQNITIIKGPGSSSYGAGTGGVLLTENLTEQEQQGALVSFTGGSFHTQNFYASVITGNSKMLSKVSFQRLESDGYRNHSASKRDVHSWTGLFRTGSNGLLKTSFVYGDLFYKTPGALTRAEYEVNPKASRPAAGAFPSAENAKASIRQKTFLAGVSYVQPLGLKWENKSSVYGMFTDLRNPTIRNYEKSSLPHVGGRTVFSFSPFAGRSSGGQLLLNVGGEWQEGFNTIHVYQNFSGAADSLQSIDEINNRQQFVFTQVSFENHDWSIMGGLSWNLSRLRFERFDPASSGRQSRKFDNELAPRLALLKKLHFGSTLVNAYTSISKGFSPPTTAELLPSGGAVNLDLDPEEGINYDLGVRTSIGKFYVDVNAFVFSLNNTIVQRRDAGGGDYFVNAGKTSQFGTETYLSYSLLSKKMESLAWVSHTWHHFEYKKFVQINNDHSGKRLPGVAPQSLAAGMDIKWNNHWKVALTYSFSDRVPLNDANTEYASSYHLLGIRLGYQIRWHKVWRVAAFGGAENLFDENYSLGNDINGFGGRYYNAAPGRNFYFSLLVEAGWK